MPTTQEILDFYAANANNPAAIQAAIQQHGITPGQLQVAGLPANLAAPTQKPSAPAVNWSRATPDQLQAQSALWTAQGVDFAEQARRAEAAGVNKDTLNAWSAQHRGAARLAIDNAYSNYGLVQGKDPDGSYNNSTTYVKNGPNRAGTLNDAQQLWNASHSGAGSRNEATGGDYSWNEKNGTWDRPVPTGGRNIGGTIYYGPDSPDSGPAGGGGTSYYGPAGGGGTSYYGPYSPNSGPAGGGGAGGGAAQGPLTSIYQPNPNVTQSGQTVGNAPVAQYQPMNWGTGQVPPSQFQTPVLNALYNAQQQRMTTPAPNFNFQATATPTTPEPQGALTQAVQG